MVIAQALGGGDSFYWGVSLVVRSDAAAGDYKPEEGHFTPRNLERIHHLDCLENKTVSRLATV